MLARFIAKLLTVGLTIAVVVCASVTFDRHELVKLSGMTADQAKAEMIHTHSLPMPMRIFSVGLIIGVGVLVIDAISWCFWVPFKKLSRREANCRGFEAKLLPTESDEESSA